MYTFFFNDTATTEIYTLSLHDALPISRQNRPARTVLRDDLLVEIARRNPTRARDLHVVRGLPKRSLEAITQTVQRSEEHTSELQSRQYLVCRLLLEKKQINQYIKHRGR